MARAGIGAAWTQIGRLFGAGTVAGLAEGQLLERFIARRDEAAFEALVARHGPMVLGVCRRLLGDAHDVDDAFQATFLVLVRRAGSIRDGDRLGPWLYGVAHRVARRIRVQSARRREREKGGEAMAAHEPTHEPEPDDLGPAVHEELARLPESYRAVIVLCDLQGCTHEEAARRLGWPVGTVKGRQSRARDRLRERLRRRGLAPTAGAVVAVLSADARAAVPPALLLSTVRAATGLAAGGVAVAAGLSSVSAVAVAEEVSRAMFLIPLKIAAAGVLALGLVASGVGAHALQDERRKDDRPEQKAKAADESKDTAGEKAPDADSRPATPEIARARDDLARARIDIARQRFQDFLDQIQANVLVGGGGGFGPSQTPIEKAYQASLNVLDVQRDALGADFDLQEALGEHLERMNTLKTAIVATRDKNPAMFGGAGPAFGNPALADYYVAQAQLWVAEAKAGKELSQPPGTTTITESGEVRASGPEGAGGLVPGGSPIPQDVDRPTRAILEALEKPIEMPFGSDTPLEDILNYVRAATESPQLPDGIPIYVDPVGLSEAERTMTTPVTIELKGVPLKTTLRLLLQQIDLNYIVKEGVVIIGSPDSDAFQREAGMLPGLKGGVPGYGIVPPAGFPEPGPGHPGGMGGGRPPAPAGAGGFR